MRYRYEIIENDHLPTLIAEVNDKARQGWRLVKILRGSPYNTAVMEIQEEVDKPTPTEVVSVHGKHDPLRFS